MLTSSLFHVHIFKAHVHMYVQNMKFQWSSLWLGLFTDDNARQRQFMIVQAVWHLCQISQNETK